MLKLDNVTLVCVDDVDIQRASKAIFGCLNSIKFGAVKLFTSNHTFRTSYLIEKQLITPITNKNEYSKFILKELCNYIKTDYIIIIQWDGFIVNPKAWDNTFLGYDYIGAPWGDRVIGNGGFSLRSKNLLKLTSKMTFDFSLTEPYSNEDVLICRINRELLEEKGIKFAPIDLAYKFSVENESYNGSFGWHGNIKPKDFDRWLIANK